MAQTTGTGMRSIRSSMAFTGRMASITLLSVSSKSNSRISAPTMKLFGFPDRKTRPLTCPERARASTCSTMAPSSSSGRRPSALALSPSRSKMAQAIPSRSIEKRQSFSCVMSCDTPASLLGCGLAVRGLRVVAESGVVGPELGGVEVIHRDDPVRQCLRLSELPALRLGQDVLADGIADPVGAVESAHLAGPDRALDLPLGLLRRDDLLKGHLEQARGIALIARDVDVARQPIPDGPRLDHQPYGLLAEPVRRRPEAAAEREHHDPHQHARPQCGEVVDGAGQGLLEAVEAVSCRKVDDGLIG